MQMGCIMRPYFRGGARILLREVSSKVQQVVLCEGAARMPALLNSSSAASAHLRQQILVRAFKRDKNS